MWCQSNEYDCRSQFRLRLYWHKNLEILVVTPEENQNLQASCWHPHCLLPDMPWSSFSRSPSVFSFLIMLLERPRENGVRWKIPPACLTREAGLISSLQHFKWGPTNVISGQHHPRTWHAGYQHQNYQSIARCMVQCFSEVQVYLLLRPESEFDFLALHTQIHS